jgi:hypothetical protein
MQGGTDGVREDVEVGRDLLARVLEDVSDDLVRTSATAGAARRIVRCANPDIDKKTALSVGRGEMRLRKAVR